MGDDEVALAPGRRKPGAGRPGVLLGLALERVVDGLGVGRRGVGIDDLSDDRVTVRAVRAGVGAGLGPLGSIDVDVTGQLRVDAQGRRGVRMMLEDQHDVGAEDVRVSNDGPGGLLVEDTHPLTLLTDLLSEDEGLAATRESVDQFRQATVGGCQHAHLGVDLGKPDGGLDVLGVGGDELGVVPGQGHGGESSLQGGRGRHDLDLETGLADTSHHTEEERVTGSDDNDVGVVGQGLNPLDGRADEAELLTLLVRNVEGVKVTLTSDDEVSIGDLLAQGVGDDTEISVDANHELSLVLEFVGSWS